MSHILGADGLQADPETINAVRDMPRPRLIFEPLRRLTDRNFVFDWLPQHGLGAVQT